MRRSDRSSHTREKRLLFVIPITYLFAIMTAFGLVMGWQAYQVLKQWGKKNNYFSMEAANQLIDCYVWCFVALAIWQFMRWFSLQGPKWKRDLVAHLLIAAATAPVATLLYIAVVAVFKLGIQDMSIESRMKLNLRAEFIPNIIEYLTMLAILVSIEHYRSYRSSQQEKFQLQHALAESKLQTLRAQLNPHFLFNAMNSVSCLLHRDPGAADRMLTRVANLLRITLARDDSREVGLLEEVELAEEYLEIQKIRFGSRLKLDIDVADEALDARVPNMLLQPLVENACVHGVARIRGDCRLEIKARLQASDLLITIYNDGPPVRPDWKANCGIGLRNTIERLSLLYGEQSSLELTNSGNGVRLQVKIPVTPDSAKTDLYDTLITSTPTHPAVM
ncbi:MAG TPA: histidine kinase [Terriglobales bacterium]|nr:histidine kinase [Terriglobales bacterium]